MRPELEKLERISKYIRKELTPEELKSFETELASSPTLQQEVSDTKAIIEEVNNISIQQKIAKAKKQYKQIKIAKIIGSCLLAIGLTTGVTYKLNNTSNEPSSTQVSELVNNESEILNTIDSSQNYKPALEVVSKKPKRSFPTYSIDNTKDTVIETDRGTIIVIPENAFGENQKNIAFQVQEYFTPLEIIEAGLSTFSNGDLLESGGMFNFIAKSNGKNISLAKGKSLLVDYINGADATGMKLFDGIKDETGAINWVNPKPLENFLTTVDINSLNFYPPNFEETLEDKYIKNASKKTKDSIFYSFYCGGGINKNPDITKEYITKTGKGGKRIKSKYSPADKGQAIFEANCTSCHQLGSGNSYPNLVGVTSKRCKSWIKEFIKNPSLFAERDSEAREHIKKWAPKAGVMSSFSFLSDTELNDLIAYLETNNTSHSSLVCDESTSQTRDYSCGIEPAQIKAIWNEKYQNTFISTREFEERLPYIYQSCSQKVLSLYINNLRSSLSDVDRMVSKIVKPELKQQFIKFANRNDGKVQVSDKNQALLNKYYQQKSKAYLLATKKTQEAFWNKHSKKDQIALQRRMKQDRSERDKVYQNFNYELQKNLKSVYKQNGLKYNVSLPSRVTNPNQSNQTVPSLKRKKKRNKQFRQFSTTSVGWKNIDRLTIEATQNRVSTTIKKAKLTYKKINISIESDIDLDWQEVYLTSNDLYSFIRLKRENDKYTYSINEDISYNLICLGQKNGRYFMYTQKNITSDASASLIQANTKEVKQALDKVCKKGIVSDFKKDIDYKQFQIVEKERRRKLKEVNEMRQTLWELIFPCKDYQEEVLQQTEKPIIFIEK